MSGTIVIPLIWSDWLKAIGAAAATIFIAAISAFITTRLAFKRFYSEKHWERKSDAYAKLLIALHHLKNSLEHEIHVIDTADLLPKDAVVVTKRQAILEELEDKMVTSVADIRMQVDIGTFAINQAAVDVLRDLLSSLDKSIDIWRKERDLKKHYEFKLAATEQCLSDLRNMARRELHRGWR